MVTDLWSADAVGIVGGEPKCCKSFLALDLAVAVASGTPCLRRFSVPQPGRVLLYAAEDALHVVRSRLEGICAAAGIGLRELDVHVITAPTLRIDLPADRDSSRADRRGSRAAAAGLGSLRPSAPDRRERQRRGRAASGLSARTAATPQSRRPRSCITPKRAAAACAPGKRCADRQSSMRGATRTLYLRRDGPKLTLTVEHRAAPSTPAIDLELVPRQDALALEVLTSAPCETPASTSIDDRITAALINASQPLSISELRPLCRVRNATLYERLTAMTAAGLLERRPDGYCIASKP